MLQVTGKSVGDFLEVLIAPVYVPDIVIDTVEEAEKRDVKSQGSRVRVCSVDRYSKSVREAKLIRGSWIAPCTIAACKPHPPWAFPSFAFCIYRKNCPVLLHLLK